MNDYKIIIKVTTDDPDHSYFVYFNRDGHDLIDVREYKIIYVPGTRPLTGRLKDIVRTARTKLLTPATGETQ